MICLFTGTIRRTCLCLRNGEQGVVFQDTQAYLLLQQQVYLQTEMRAGSFRIKCFHCLEEECCQHKLPLSSQSDAQIHKSRQQIICSGLFNCFEL